MAFLAAHLEGSSVERATDSRTAAVDPVVSLREEGAAAPQHCLLTVYGSVDFLADLSDRSGAYDD
jgi:hypothetical protein